MSLTHSFKSTIRERAERDTEFRVALLAEAAGHLLAADLETAKEALRAYIDATSGFERLVAETGISTKSLSDTVGSCIDPTAQDLLDLLCALRQGAGAQSAASEPE